MSAYLGEILSLCIEVGECIEWAGKFGTGRNSGTPILKKHNRETGRCDNIPVTRTLWEVKNGPIPAGKIVYRHCGNDRCVGCLKLGVRGDAHRRRKVLGLMKHSPAALSALTRGARGRADVKCSEQIAADIRRLVADGVHDAEIIVKTGMTPDIVSSVRLNRCWKQQVNVSSVFNWRPA